MDSSTWAELLSIPISNGQIQKWGWASERLKLHKLSRNALLCKLHYKISLRFTSSSDFKLSNEQTFLRLSLNLFIYLNVCKLFTVDKHPVLSSSHPPNLTTWKVKGNEEQLSHFIYVRRKCIPEAPNSHLENWIPHMSELHTYAKSLFRLQFYLYSKQLSNYWRKTFN